MLRLRWRSLAFAGGLGGLTLVAAMAATGQQPTPAAASDAARPVMRRLTRTEYANAVRDLLGVDVRLRDELPADAVAFGFDNNGDALSLSPLLFEKYLDAARKVAQAISDPSQKAARSRLFICRPARAEEPCAARILTAILRRAWRRDITAADARPFIALYDKARAQSDFEQAVGLAIQAILVSPDFIFRIERDPQGAIAGRTYPLGDFELATRLSFLIWSSIPDDRLLDAARAGRLRSPAGLNREVARMLKDPKAAALADNFGMQYLGLEGLDDFTPDKLAYPNFQPALRGAFKEETRRFLQGIIGQNRSVVELVSADYSYLNADLARHYGIDGVAGERFRKVLFKPDQPRGGVLTQGSVLLVTSHEDVTSPVLRGKWVLSNLLNQPPQDQPPGVPPISATDVSGHALTGRAQLEQHRSSPVCAGCHARMDPFGLSLENFDVTGAWRLKDEGGALNVAVTLPDGTGWNGVAGLKQYLTSRPDQLANAFAGRLMIYALGRRLEATDRSAIAAIVRKAAPQGYRFNDILMGVINSAQFRMRRAGST